ncbi:MAG: aminotransferase class V-fold PLP-dependent enzyme, partial [Corynebacterium flavescens]|nr:aminotransferase class V-fold PLP-dependent enzyme [Corynebacterium flavescens]
SEIGMDNIHAHEKELCARALEGLQSIPGVRIVGPSTTENRGGAVSFVVDGVHPHDLGQVLDDRGVSIRTGHHCAWPLHRACNINSTARASFYLYNTVEEVDKLIEAVKAAREFFRVEA